MIIRNLYWVVTAAVLAIIVHISMVLFAPGFLFDRNLNRLASDVPDNTFFILPAAAQSRIFPEYPSGTVFGLCRFNLTSGPVTLDANLPDGIWTLTVYSRFGRTLYTVTDEQSGVDTFSLQLAMAPGVLDVFSLNEDDTEVETSGWKVLSSDERGFAVFWVPALDKAMRESLSETLSKTSCGKAAVSS
ncbi:MAG TPA: hypothetical protein PLK44_11165 [Aestuariivirga sp.]|nr:hypothetical protein [Hyphomicrobiales bacterium]MBP9174239.1 hypothetical protein [Hyphomicrobiales bacterium]MCC7483110.1 hypothetical protein [Hyphomicrobiales bacterium]HQY74265.1 hypothetical protein [Aestuariivirga sp.]